MLVNTPVLSDKDFRRLSTFIHDGFGIKLPESKKTMLESRLQKRLRVLKMDSFQAYCDYVFTDEGMNSELINMIDVVTTNKTDFYREPSHFDYLINNILPAWMNNTDVGTFKSLRVWSAGCSSGEEPYTLAMILSDFKESNPRFQFTILATDISSQVLSKAKDAVYEMEKVEVIPMITKRKYLLKSKNSDQNLVRMKPFIRSSVNFMRLNLMDHDFHMSEKYDIIFCRNVIIYFDRPTQQKLIRKLYDLLNSGGYLFLGHSETLCAIDISLVTVAPTIYRKVN